SGHERPARTREAREYRRAGEDTRGSRDEREQPMTAALEQHDWNAGLARRAHTLGGGGITAILALAGGRDVVALSGGVPDPATCPVQILAGLAARVITEDAAVSLQYSATEGIAGVRDYLAGRLAALEGAPPAPGGLLVTSGGIDCLELLAK